MKKLIDFYNSQIDVIKSGIITAVVCGGVGLTYLIVGGFGVAVLGGFAAIWFCVWLFGFAL